MSRIIFNSTLIVSSWLGYGLFIYFFFSYNIIADKQNEKNTKQANDDTI